MKITRVIKSDVMPSGIDAKLLLENLKGAYSVVMAERKNVMKYLDSIGKGDFYSKYKSMKDDLEDFVFDFEDIVEQQNIKE